MPFLDDSGPKPEEERSPLGRTFALLRDQLERMVALNVFLALQGAPLLAAWAFPLPDALRIALSLYSALALPPALLAVYAVMRRTGDGELIGGGLLLACLREMLRPGLLALMPLLSLFFWLGAGAMFFAAQGWLLPDALARLLILLLAVASLYWGPLLAAQPEWPLWRALIGSARLVWRYPATSLAAGGLSLVALALGVISIAGMVLIVPVFVALLQTEHFRWLIDANGSKDTKGAKV